MITALKNRLRRGESSGEQESGENGDEPEFPEPDARDEDLARAFVEREVVRSEEAFNKAWHDDFDLDESVDALNEWWGWRVVRRQLVSTTPGVLTFYVDSYVLDEAYRTLFEDSATETVAYMTGVVVNDQVRTLNRLVEIEHDYQSAVGASGDPDSSAAELIKLSRDGHQMLGYIHNHPGTGRSSSRPSATDRDNQARLEGIGYEAVGVILTEDGYIRFFSNDLEFVVEIYGDGIERVDDKLYSFRSPENNARTSYGVKNGHSSRDRTRSRV